MLFGCGREWIATSCDWAWLELHAEPLSAAWSGEGLPPAGTVCEYQNSLGSWFQVEITAIAKKGICFIQTERDGENYACQVSSKFRLIRTPEQKAEEEREKEAIELFCTINWNGGETEWGQTSERRKADYYKAIDAGYRKFEIHNES